MELSSFYFHTTWCYFREYSYARANVRITYEKTKGTFPWEHQVVWNAKTNVQSQKVHSTFHFLVHFVLFFRFSRIANQNVSELQVTLNISVSGKDLPGQGFSLHERVIKPSPWQSSPPWAGDGLVQVLLRLWTPPPQVTWQVLQGFQLAQPPSTLFCQVAKKRKINHSDLSLQSCFIL